MAKAEKVSGRIEMDLFAPGMTIMHRAGLGGLACTLKFIEKKRKTGALTCDQIPGEPWDASNPPWHITDRAIVLNPGDAKQSEVFFKRLFEVAFQIRDGLIYIPAMFSELEPNKEVLCNIHNALLLTFLQHGRVRKTEKVDSVVQFDPDGLGMASVSVSYKRCSGFKNQTGWQDLQAGVPGKQVEISGSLNPGAVVRHNAFGAHTKIFEKIERALPLYFAIGGCSSFCINKGVGVLVAPDVLDLKEFIVYRPFMTPSTARECRVSGASDAALQLQVRLIAKRNMAAGSIPACTAMAMAPTPWASQQKSRIKVISVPNGREPTLHFFEKAMGFFPPRIIPAKKSMEKNSENASKPEYFWADSKIRPLIADNLATGKPWYAGFTSLMSGKESSQKTSFEREGAYAMIQNTTWDNPGAEVIIKAVHEAIRLRFGKIADECRHNPVAMRKRWTNEKERWRMAFAGAKTPDRFRFALSDLWSRAGGISILKAGWQKAIPMLVSDQWQLARDLALLGLASYSGKEGDEELQDIKQEGATNE